MKVLFLIVAVVVCVYVGSYFVDMVQNPPCSSLTGCDKFRCQANNCVTYGCAQTYLLKEQNCLINETGEYPK